ncbi:hypothetical protein [Abyssalbus ytuae]|uniref:Uncharacterized protein n=1 Tax=Abyssalbus ytuae TaxID=2926907 RepID=A0A9E7D0F2_9FLAO|nr:hypothetical protein [Abyssalbus ytuae]UOB18370.1 hypothetical protein MQE35_03550 [Abyssalbus ytuae]
MRESFRVPISLLGGHSHGGNVARIASKKVLSYLVDGFRKEEITEMPKIHLLMLNTPTMSENNPISGDTPYKFNMFQNAMIETFQVDSNFDLVAGFGQFITEAGSLNAFYSKTKHIIEYTDQLKSWSATDIGNHLGNENENVKVWYPIFKEIIKEK